MKTIRIDHLDLKCRGVEAATARAALRELGPALARRLDDGGDGGSGAESATIRVGVGVTPAALAGAVATRITAAVRAPSNSGRKS